MDLATNAPASVLETLCRRFRGVARAERETPEEADERRKVVVHHTDDGRLRLSVELDADEGARLLAALDLARFDVSAEAPRNFDVSAETPRARADALMVLVESFLAESARSRTGGTPTEVLLHVTEDELESGGGFIENAGCVGVSAETSRRLACDAAVVEVGEDVHESGYRIERDAQGTQFVAPGKRPLPMRAPLPSHRARRSSGLRRRTRSAGYPSARCR